jgi:hypothetical protein
MKRKRDLLAYCGLYCGDCQGYTGVIADAARDFMTVLEKYKFDRTAKCVFPEELKDYDRLCEMLGFMTGLRCEKVCREREDSSITCEVAICCRDRGSYACYGCDDLEICEKLKALHEGLHYDSCVKNLKAIREMGLEAWTVRGRQHCYWNKVDDCP